jgi:hypothetical protein
MTTHSSGVMRGLEVALIAISCCTAPALAGWGVDPVTVTPTTAGIPMVEGCSDGAYGAFAAWQEEATPGGGVLRVQHLLANGDLDPAWPGPGAVACAVVAARSELVALSDQLGGLYLLWKEGATLYATRLDASGTVSAGWPARGRSLGDVDAKSPRPGVIADGAHGFYAVWVNSSSQVMGMHLGPSNTGAGGWPGDGLWLSDLDTFGIWPQLAPAPDGGVYVAWGTYGRSPYLQTPWTPGVWRLQRLTTAGDYAPGWPFYGLELGTFHIEYIANFLTTSSLLALEADGRGGTFLMIGNPTSSQGSLHQVPTLETRLYRLRGDAESAVDWPVGGQIVPHASTTYPAGLDPDGSYRLLSDHRDGVYVGAFQFVFDGPNFEQFKRCSASGQFTDAATLAAAGYEIAARGDGGIYYASFECCVSIIQFAFIWASEFPIVPSYYYETHTEAIGAFYSDIGLARTDDGGAIFLWSQVQARVGLFALRFNSAGQVTGVGPGPSLALGLSHIRFVRGQGVRAAFSVPGPGAARFDLFDLAGRHIVSQSVEPGAREMTVAGTTSLPSGLYFGRLVAGERAAKAKVIVAR